MLEDQKMVVFKKMYFWHENVGNLGATQERAKTFCMPGPEVACKKLRGWSGRGSPWTQKVKMGLDKTQQEQVNMGLDFEEKQFFCLCQPWVTAAQPHLFVYLLSTSPAAWLGQNWGATIETELPKA